eukprot:52853-Chlamydomonas_euryale.AAC.10
MQWIPGARARARSAGSGPNRTVVLKSGCACVDRGKHIEHQAAGSAYTKGAPVCTVLRRPIPFIPSSQRHALSTKQRRPL